MAERPQRACRKTSSYSEQTEELGTRKICKKAKINTRKLYDVQVVDRDNLHKKIKIHYVGFEEKYDEWVDYSSSDCPIVKHKKLMPLTTVSYEDRLTSFLDKCCIEIKKKLQIHRLIDPDEKVLVSGEADLFEVFFSSCVKKASRGRTFYYPKDLRDLDHLLGLNWDKRIVNKAGDFAYVVKDQLRITVTSRKPVKEYMYQGGAYVEVANEQHQALAFNFTTSRVGNKRQYEESR